MDHNRSRSDLQAVHRATRARGLQRVLRAARRRGSWNDDQQARAELLTTDHPVSLREGLSLVQSDFVSARLLSIVEARTRTAAAA